MDQGHVGEGIKEGDVQGAGKGSRKKSVQMGVSETLDYINAPGSV